MADEQIIVDIKVNSTEVTSAKNNINQLTDSIEELGNRISTARKQNSDYKKEQQDLNKLYDQGKISTDKYLTEIDKLNTKIQTNNKIIAESKVSMSSLNNQRNANIKLVNSESGAYQKLSAQYTLAAKKAKDLGAAYGVESKQAKEAAQNANLLGEKLKQIDGSVGQHARNVGNYTSAWKNFGKQILSATGIVFGINAAVNAINNMIARSKELVKINYQVSDSFNVEGEQAKMMTSQVKALATTFDVDYKEILNAANAVQKTFGITGSESLKLIEEGFKKGSNNTGEFLDMLREYPTQFKAAGIDAEQMFAIINQQVKAGIYSDKGVDTIKEAGLRLRENTKTVQDALKPLDESIKQQIKQEIAAGNTFKAIQLVSKALSTTNLTAQQTQTIIADVFGGPGEDAGLEYIKTLKDVQLNLNDVAESIPPVQSAQLELDKSYNNFIQSVSDGKGILSSAWASILNFANQYLKDLAQLNSEQSTFTEKLVAFAGSINVIFPGIRKAVDRSTQAFRELFSTGKKTWDLNELEKTNALIKSRQDYVKQKYAEIEQMKLDAKEREKNNNLEALGNNIKNDSNNLTKDQISNLKKIREEREKNEQAIYEMNLADEGQGPSPFSKIEEQQIEAARKKEEAIKKINEDLALMDIENREAERERMEIDTQWDLDNEDWKNEQLIEKEKQKQEAIKELKNTFFDEAENYAQEIAAMKADERLAKIQANSEAQEEILKNQLDKGLISEDEYNQKVEELNKKTIIAEAKANKRKNLFQVGIDTVAAVIKTFANLGWPAGIIPAGVMAGIGAIKSAFIAAQPIPNFAGGTNDIVNIGNSHASGNDVSVWGFARGQKQFFGKVEKGEAMPVIRKSALSDYMVAKLNGKFNPINSNRTFAGGTNDITQQVNDNANLVNGMIAAMSNVKIVAKIEDITKEAGRKMEIVNNSKV